MQNRLTQALGCGEISSVSEYERITRAILDDSWLYNEVMKSIVSERGIEIIQQAPQMVRDAFLRRIKFVKPAPQIRIVWTFVPAHATASQNFAMLRVERFYGESKVPDEVQRIRPRNEQELVALRDPWTGSAPPAPVMEQYRAALNPPIESESQRVIREAKEQQQKHQPREVKVVWVGNTPEAV
jgi:hypothetical protein